MRFHPAFIFFAAVLLVQSSAWASSTDEKMEEMREMFSSPYSEEMYYRTDRLLLTATDTLKPLHRAPAVATIITAEEIKKMGAVNLREVLETVPGVHIIPSSLNRLDPIIAIRGIQTKFNSQVLVMMNGYPIANAFYGSRIHAFRLPVANISRIEVIRGPGSAVHGADAFAGTVNIITKEPYELEDPQVGFRVGSFDFYDTWLQFGSKVGGWDAGLSLEYQRSNGDPDRIIEEDQQTILDRIAGTSASLAPGPLDTGYEVLDTHFRASKDEWSFRFWGWLQDNAGVGLGVSNTLSTGSSENSRQFLADVTYRNSDAFRYFEPNFRLSYMYVSIDSFLQLFPPGADPLFPGGVIGNPSGTEHHAGIDFIGYYTRWSRHTIRLGSGFKYVKVETEESKNFGPGVIPGVLTDVSNTPYVFSENQVRKIWHGSVQDEWAFARHWELTTGLRYDHYSDFGDTLNPRVALVWEPRFDLTAKLLYGRAFRPPSFAEQFLINNPSTLGNPNLEPERIQTWEMALDYIPTAKLHTVLNVFTYEIEDLIEFIPDPGETTATAQNAKNQDGYGFELKADFQVTEAVQLQGNISYQHSEDEVTSDQIPDVPNWQAYLNAHWRFWPKWSFDMQYFWIGKRKRSIGDTRAPLSEYDWVNITLRRQEFLRHWEIGLAIRNLFDVDAREPASAVVPKDIPLPGRSVYGELRYNF